MKYLNKQFEEITERISELNEYKAKMMSQIDILNDQFKMNVIESFSNFDVVEKIKSIIYGVGVDL